MHIFSLVPFQKQVFVLIVKTIKYVFNNHTVKEYFPSITL